MENFKLYIGDEFITDIKPLKYVPNKPKKVMWEYYYNRNGVYFFRTKNGSIRLTTDDKLLPKILEKGKKYELKF